MKLVHRGLLELRALRVLLELLVGPLDLLVFREPQDKKDIPDLKALKALQVPLGVPLVSPVLRVLQESKELRAQLADQPV